jgi:hypothetical protein
MVTAALSDCSGAQQLSLHCDSLFEAQARKSSIERPHVNWPLANAVLS